MKSILITLFLGLSTFVYSQTKLSGTITDIENKPIIGANIVLPELQKETVSDSNGNYVLTSIPKGSYKVIFSFVGFATQTQRIEFSEKSIFLNIKLVERQEHMDEVVVSTSFNKMQSQNVMKVEQQSIKSLQQKGFITLIEGLSSIPGVSQISTGISIGKPVIRGLSGNRVLVYSQGIRLENQQFGEEHGLGLNDSGVESVEVIKGPASLLYGSDALGGVVFFNPEKFALPNSIKANFSQKIFSNTHGSSTNFGINTASEKWKFITRIKHDIHSDYKTPDSNKVTNSRFNETDFKTALGFSNSKISSIIRYNFNKLNIGIPEEGYAEQSSDKKPLFPYQNVKNHILSLNNIIYFKNSKVESNFGFISNNRSEFEDSVIPILNMKLNTFNYDVKYFLPAINNFESIIGVQGLNQTNKNFGEELLIPNAEVRDVGFYSTIYKEINKNTFQLGVRFDNRKIQTQTHGNSNEEGYFEALDKSFSSFNSSIGYKNTSFNNFIIRINVASGFRAPNLAELTSNGVHEGSNRYEIGNSNLKNEQNLQTDLNIEFASSHFEFFVNGFYNYVKNYIYINPTNEVIDENFVYNYIQSDAKLYGGELGIHFHPHPFDWLHVTSSFESVTGKKNDSQYLPLIPSNKWNTTLKTEFKDLKKLKNSFCSLNFEYYLAQNNPGIFETRTSQYSLLNFALGSKVALNKVNLDFNFNINNLLNKNYISHLSRLKTDQISNIGRNIVFGVNLSI